MELDRTFPHNYEVAFSPDFPAADGPLYFPGRPHLVLEIQPRRGEPWTGVIGHRGGTPNFVTGAFTTPDPDVICVIDRGSGYLVDVLEPEREWEELDCEPVRDVRMIPSRVLIVFANFTDLVAYGVAEGELEAVTKVWRTDRLGWDDLEIVRVTDEAIEGRAWNAPEDRMMGFRVDLQTGTHEGGAYRL